MTIEQSPVGEFGCWRAVTNAALGVASAFTLPDRSRRVKNVHEVELEICCDSVAGATAACIAGAHRVELCATGSLIFGGTTPPIGAVTSAAVAFRKLRRRCSLHVLIRCRPGGFAYSTEELLEMEADIASVAAAGADGVVIGCLTPAGEVDTAGLIRLIHAAKKGSCFRTRPLEISFHRAFDVVQRPMGVPEMIALVQRFHEFGIHRILTSGRAATAWEGRDVLLTLIRAAEPFGVTICAASGVNPANVAELVSVTGLRQVHAAGSASGPSSARHELVHAAGGEKGALFEAPFASEQIVLAERVRDLLSALPCSRGSYKTLP